LSTCSTGSQHSEQSDSDSQGDGDYEVEIPVYYKKLMTESLEGADTADNSDSKKPRIIADMLASPDVSSVVDRINLSDRKFTLLAAAIARASGQDLDSASLSRSTVCRKRSQHRATIDTQVRQEFQSGEKTALVIHWDGKLMKDSTNLENPKSNIDRLAVIVTGCNVDKVLGIVKIAGGTGQAQANATFQFLNLWEVTNDIVGMCFDTTASNTGPHSGACVLLENLVGRQLMYFACRHHVHEIIIGNVFTVLFGPSRGPNIALFERFTKHWQFIDKQNYKPLEDARLNTPFLQQRF
jgi:hypothetical protein